MIDKLTNKVIKQNNIIYEGLISDKIASIKDEKLRKDLELCFEKAQKVFNNRITYVNWFFNTTFKKGYLFNKTLYYNTINPFLSKFEHYYNYNLPAINNLDVTKFDEFSSVFDKMEEYVKKHEERQKRIIPVDSTESKKIVHVCRNPNFVWYDLETCSSDEESSAMAHFGSDSRGTTLFSLREKTFDNNGSLIGYTSRITMTYEDKLKSALQVKGYKNQKPSQKYIPFFMELVENGIVNSIDLSDSYKPFNDLHWMDFSKEEIKRLALKNKNLAKNDPFVDAVVNPSKNGSDLEISYGIKVHVDGSGNISPTADVFIQSYDLHPFLISSYPKVRLDMPDIIYDTVFYTNYSESYIVDTSNDEEIFFSVNTKDRTCSHFYVRDDSSVLYDFYCKPFNFDKFSEDESNPKEMVILHNENGAAISGKSRKNKNNKFKAYFTNGKPYSGSNVPFLSETYKYRDGKFKEKNYFLNNPSGVVKTIGKSDDTETCVVKLVENKIEIIFTQNRDGSIVEVYGIYNTSLMDPYYVDEKILFDNNSYVRLIKRGEGKPSWYKKVDGKLVESVEVKEYSTRLVKFYEDGVLKFMSYIDGISDAVEDSIFHPSEVYYFDNGQVYKELWYENEKLHREDNLPAVIEYDINGNLVREDYYINGNKQNVKSKGKK